MFLALVSPASQYRPITPPLGLLYIAAYLRERFPLDIQVVHQRVANWSSEELARRAIDFKADIVGLGCLTPGAYALPEITAAIRAAMPETLIVLGGPHVAVSGATALANTSADAAVAGEGEIAMEQILNAYLNGEDMRTIPGLIWRDPAGSIVTNPGMTPVVKDLDSLPIPAYDLIDIYAYHRINSMVPIPRRRYIALFSSRGCPYSCTYCHNIFGRRFRMHSAERIVEEIKVYKSRYDIDEIEFVDDCFNLDRRRVVSFTEGLLRDMGPIKIAFPNAIRADLLDTESVDTLVAAGMYFTALALESASPRIQEMIGKRLNIPKYLEAVALCAQRRVFTYGFVMLGFPTETAEEIEETIRVAAESQLHIASFFTLTPFPNTRIHEEVKATYPEKVSCISYSDMEYWKIPINFSALPDEAFFACQRRAYRRFYLEPQRLYRIMRDYPKPHLLPTFGAMFLKRLMKGIFNGRVA